MTVRVGINGFGRLGRTYLRAALERAEAGTQDVGVVAVNDIASPATLAHLLEHDSTFGHIGRDVAHDDNSITVDGRRGAAVRPGPQRGRHHRHGSQRRHLRPSRRPDRVRRLMHCAGPARRF
ncbi:glyceraldehyde 3-phosphate dehydrogenase NAD-binding domain-containing protein [Streptomyces fructofermentans]|uniref:glyceraldehyde 3-phosphate dehydrogenase NAD-binding domain-containing protein n=1 Tax=Streptomyces fructofermentans TaxID=152141 RepID=UPI003404B68A